MLKITAVFSALCFQYRFMYWGCPWDFVPNETQTQIKLKWEGNLLTFQRSPVFPPESPSLPSRGQDQDTYPISPGPCSLLSAFSAPSLGSFLPYSSLHIHQALQEFWFVKHIKSFHLLYIEPGSEVGITWYSLAVDKEQSRVENSTIVVQ